MNSCNRCGGLYDEAFMIDRDKLRLQPPPSLLCLDFAYTNCKQSLLRRCHCWYLKKCAAENWSKTKHSKDFSVNRLKRRPDGLT